MSIVMASDAEYGFCWLIDLARAEPVAVAKHGRPVVMAVEVEVEEFERLKALEHRGVSMRNSAVRKTGAGKDKS